MAGRALVRVAFYLYFSFACAQIITAVLLLVWLRLGASADYLLWVGPGVVAWAAFLVMLAILVVPRAQMFDQPISLSKWFSLCLAATVLGVLSVMWMFSATFCVVCL